MINQHLCIPHIRQRSLASTISESKVAESDDDDRENDNDDDFVDDDDNEN